MKQLSIISVLMVITMLIAVVVPASAQLGDNDISSFTVQNVGAATATVTITFYEEDGTAVTPTELNNSQPNPFTLAVGASFEVYVPGIPDAQLPNGSYSVVISADQQVVAIANLIGQGTINFNGSYSGFSSGATPFYLPSIVYNYYGWYSLISVQNVGSANTDVTVSITCSDGTTGTLSTTGLAPMTSVHYDLNGVNVPSGFSASTRCSGSAQVTSTGEPVVVVDNQRVPASGNTQSYGGFASGSTQVSVPALYTSYYGWNASMNIRKITAGNVSVSVAYSDSGTSSCSLTDARPSCLLYMPTEHPTSGYFGATVTATGGDVVAIVNSANGAQAQTYNGVNPSNGTSAVGIPSVMKSYYGWNTSFTCQNVGSVDTSLNISYDSYSANAYDTTSLSPGGTLEIFQPAETFLPSSYQGGALITANAGSSAAIACIVNFNNAGLMSTGDWSMSYNAFNR